MWLESIDSVPHFDDNYQVSSFSSICNKLYMLWNFSRTWSQHSVPACKGIQAYTAYMLWTSSKRSWRRYSQHWVLGCRGVQCNRHMCQYMLVSYLLTIGAISKANWLILTSNIWKLNRSTPHSLMSCMNFTYPYPYQLNDILKLQKQSYPSLCYIATDTKAE